MLRNQHCVELLEDTEQPSFRYGTKTLTDLVDCFAESKHVPYSNFRFNSLSKCRSSDMTRFFSLWGKDIVTLQVSVDDLERNIGIMKELIFENVPNLKHLEIEFRKETYAIPSSVRLFNDSNKLQLPKLEVLCICDRDRKYRGVIEDILEAASNLNSFVVLKPYDVLIAKDLEMLQSFGKLHCLKNLPITWNLINHWKMLPNSMNLKLHTLTVPRMVNDQSEHEFVNELLRSSKDVIHTLSIRHPTLLNRLVIPKLENLQTLSLHLFDSITDLSDLADTFPNVRTLDIYCLDEYFPYTEQPLKPMSSVEVLRIRGGLTGADEDVMKMFPNVKTLLMIADDYFDPVFHFREISKHWPNLENLGWKVRADTRFDVMPYLDSLITGLSHNFCKKLSDKFRDIDYVSAAKAFNYQLQHMNSSILDLKELKKFDVQINFASDPCICHCTWTNSNCDCTSDDEDNKDEAGFGSESIFYKTGFTKVSKFLAFDRMPNLKLRIQRTT